VQLAGARLSEGTVISIEVTFWGVRGSIACPSIRHLGFGGNTSCVAVSAGGRQLILDAGTGIRDLGKALLARGERRHILLLSHCHWDHINGFPFFAPAYCPGHELRVLAGHLSGKGGIRNVLAGQMSHPTFPVPLEAMKAQLVFEDFVAGDELDLGPEIRVRTAPLNHPDGATAYRIDHAGKSVCYVTDTEHRQDGFDPLLLSLIADADMMIYDATFTDAEYRSKIGWGHSTWQEGLRLCRAAGVKRYVMFHHNPDHDDLFLADIEKQAKSVWPAAEMAREGTTVVL
jgi:phosphoribosyl 1,2-cyclic phosphodiesterase